MSCGTRFDKNYSIWAAIGFIQHENTAIVIFLMDLCGETMFPLQDPGSRFSSMASSQSSFTFLEALALPLCQHSSQMVAFHEKISPGKRDIQTIWRGDNGNVYIHWRGFPGCEWSSGATVRLIAFCQGRAANCHHIRLFNRLSHY